MSEPSSFPFPPAAANDPTAPGRKEDHIELAFQSQTDRATLDQRFDYEPLLAAHPAPGSLPPVTWGGKRLRAPLWVSSMTGGTEKALTINHNLARAAGEFGIGMGLGSCRSLLYEDQRFEDFNVRPLAGSEVPIFANLGAAQVQHLLERGEAGLVTQLIDALQLDGLIVHVNPFQEWLQPEGDRFTVSPLETIRELLRELPTLPLIVKEVGQGMGPASLRALLQLPILALDTAANGGTNFSKLELFRSDALARTAYGGLTQVGHSAEEMVRQINRLVVEEGDKVRCANVIVSGGVSDFLDGYYLTELSALPAIYGQASAFLRHAREDYLTLQRYVATQLRGLELAKAYLRPRP
ncbi:isopentenyl-diphosphate delta-isomerase [Lewinella marina]|uniref:Type 2 isopentenyl-diphosphate Delta-isomerase n=1 Tax=Neolewinella marina TaxID=438751 RepID=A0A2G0CD84_9BACT|nr:type 2 isopentenyl-diphosphate Delta-isomerase [Neolewinella marina]NJB86859.1 isopentenyl-diphosphate delta-isomerase [Neolewinella marina]PHK97941.1 type 2 isopentenyl-diphosphate Delta-isomerase [Neolewinella marina]